MEVKIQPLSMQLCRNCGHAMHWHSDERRACGFCQASPQMQCSCREFKFPNKEKARKLPVEEQKKLAFANHLGVDPRTIRKIEPVVSSNMLIGSDVTVYVYTGDKDLWWIQEHLPKDEDWLLRYIEWLERQKK